MLSKLRTFVPKNVGFYFWIVFAGTVGILLSLHDYQNTLDAIQNFPIAFVSAVGITIGVHCGFVVVIYLALIGIEAVSPRSTLEVLISVVAGVTLLLIPVGVFAIATDINHTDTVIKGMLYWILLAVALHLSKN